MEEKKVLLKEIDLLGMVGRVMKKWKFVLIVTLCSTLFGLVIALSTARSYTSEIIVAPESSPSSNMSSNINSLASMIGLNIAVGGGEDAIYPMLYPDIVRSLPFLTSLFDVRVNVSEYSIDTTFYSYLQDYRKETWLDAVAELPGKAMDCVRGIFSSSKESKIADPVFNPYMLSKSQMKMVEMLDENISIFVDKKTSVLSLSFTDRDPLIVAAMTDTIMNRLQQEITEYRTKKAINDCKYIEKMYLEAKDSLEDSQKRYADFVSRNRNIVNEYVLVEMEKLGADKELKTVLHEQWAQQLLLARAKVQERTPVFVTLKPASVPVYASSMSRMLKMVLFAFIGCVLAIIYVLQKDSIKNICRKLFDSNK